MTLTRRLFLKLIGSSALFFSATLAYGLGLEAQGRPVVRTYAFVPPRWTAGLKLKIAVLADIHCCDPWMPEDRLKEIVSQTNQLGADLILIVGDFIAGMRRLSHPLPSEVWSAAIAGLKAPLGVYSVLGNHDYWHDAAYQHDPTRTPVVQEALEKVGLPVLVNKAVRLEKDGKPFWVAGLGDQIARIIPTADGEGRTRGIDDLPAVTAQLTDDAPAILMAHEPDIFPQVPERFCLTLSGHTHGGQVNIFGYMPAVPSRYGSRYGYGHKFEQDRHLITSGGIGCSILPIRIGRWPEILMVELG